MKISLAVVGKIGKSFLNTGIDEYTRRLSHYVNFDIQYISDAKNTKNLTEKQQKQQEGVNILASLDTGDYVVLLDDYRLIKFLRRPPDPAKVILRSANPDYDDMEISRADIRELMLVQHILHLESRM